jgi:CheY-like chemotaxis protein
LNVNVLPHLNFQQFESIPDFSGPVSGGRMEKILIVEDHSDLQKLLEMTLRKTNRTFFHTDSGIAALEIARQKKPDVILLDIKLSGAMDGIEVTRRLRALPATRHCPILILTAKVHPTDKAEAMAAGANEYIGKPFKLASLKKTIEKYLPAPPDSVYARKDLPVLRVAEDSPQD